MRRIILLLVAVAVAMGAMAQDLLVKRNGDKLNVKVLSVSKRKVKYVRQGTDMPVYTLKVSEIDYIEYPLGDRDTFGKGGVVSQQQQQQQQVQPQQQPQTPARWHGPVAPPEGAPRVESITSSLPTEGRIYEIGDIYEKDGVKGIVVLLTEGGRHGVVMSLDEACLAWSEERTRDAGKVGANSTVDGEENMRAVERYIIKTGLSWSMFPAFEWCRAKGEGWYLPALNEIWSAGTMYLGGSRLAVNRRLRKGFNNSLVEAGGKALSNTMYYYSSTEHKDEKFAYYTHMSSESPQTNTDYKSSKLFVRAFHKF